MKTLITFLIITSIACVSKAQFSFPASCFTDSHDISSLPCWGPYSKRYAGISHIPKLDQGIRFDFSVMPGYYRNKQFIPHVLFESSYYPWSINPQLDKITYRYELEWKDKVFCDVTYHTLDEQSVLVQMDCQNNTTVNQNLMLNLFSYLDFENNRPLLQYSGTEHVSWHKAIDYKVNEPAFKSPQYGLVYDGKKRNEEFSENSLSGFIVGNDFGKDKGDRILFSVNIEEGQEAGVIAFRHNTPIGTTATFRVSGIVNTTVEFKGEGKYVLTKVPYQCSQTGTFDLELVSEGTSGTKFDGFFIGKETEVNSIDIVSQRISHIPEIEKNNLDVILKYDSNDGYYGIAWDDSMSCVREVLNSELESYFRKKTHDHVSVKFTGDKKFHYTNVFIRPVVVEPNSRKTLYAYICYGEYKSVKESIAQFHAKKRTLSLNEPKKQDSRFFLPEGKKYEFGQQLLQAALLSNIVYPIYTQGEYIRHFTPGKNWNSLYTWDSGFIASGLIDVDIVKAFECIRAYTTPVGSESAFIHHGTPLPIQIYAFLDLWNRSRSKEMLSFLYPRLKQFFDFMIGEKPYSTTCNNKTGLLKTWDYFYNSGGWDDYPPQKSLKNVPLKEKNLISPVVTSAYYIRAAKILRLAAEYLGKKEDIRGYDNFIRRTSKSLLTYSWDEESNYFGYVVHDSLGNFSDIYRYKDGTNYNKGLDGTSPLIANICSEEQNQKLLDHIFSSNEMWTEVGISTVDQSAPYYEEDGYWNGAVWFPHQFLVWKSLLDMGEGEKAFLLAQTALRTWEKECSESYYTFEHFIISSQRGAGWHQFSGLSSPILNWYNAYYKIGKVSTGFELWLDNSKFNSDYSEFTSTVMFDSASSPHNRILLVCMNPDYSYKATINGKKLKIKERYPGLLEIYLPSTNKKSMLMVKVD